MSRFIPLSVPNFEGNEEKYVRDAVAAGWVSTGGAYITELEEKMADFLKVKKAVACQSGSAALHLAMMECGVGPGDHVIVPTLTFIAAVNPVKYQFAEPIFMDSDDSLCMDPQKLEAFCGEECEMREDRLFYKKTGKPIKALVVVHVFGNMADMESIMDICERYHIRVIEDATEALGTKYETGRYAGKYAGTIGDFGAYSYNGNKIITTGGGGMLVARNEAEAEHIHYISTQAKDDTLFYIHNEVGYNYRMTNVQAALGVAQMEELPEFIQRKNYNYEDYRKKLEKFPYGQLLGFRPGVHSNRWFYSLQIKDQVLERLPLREFIFRLQDAGVQTRAIWGLIHEQKPYLENEAYQIEKAKYYSTRILNLPCSTNLKEEDIIFVVDTLEKTLTEFMEER